MELSAHLNPKFRHKIAQRQMIKMIPIKKLLFKVSIMFFLYHHIIQYF